MICHLLCIRAIAQDSQETGQNKYPPPSENTFNPRDRSQFALILIQINNGTFSYRPRTMNFIASNLALLPPPRWIPARRRCGRFPSSSDAFAGKPNPPIVPPVPQREHAHAPPARTRRHAVRRRRGAGRGRALAVRCRRRPEPAFPAIQLAGDRPNPPRAPPRGETPLPVPNFPYCALCSSNFSIAGARPRRSAVLAR